MDYKKNNFVIYSEWYITLKHLSNARLGKLYRAMNEYHIDGKVTTELDTELSTAFKFMQTKFVENHEKYLKTCAKNRDNIIKRWEQEKSKE